MAFKFQRDDDLGALSDINVTPLVDVMLVLLIIFMVTAPMMMQGLSVELPAAEGETFETQSSNPTTITVVASGAVYLDETPLGSDLELSLATLLRGRKITRALLRADQSVPYGQIVHVIDVMNRAGVEEIGIITETWEDPGAGRSR
ncbi:MAG TPA: ExbD/TolR family protein [Thermoanaerobaculia bacterium]|nr:ExbD/TolR family protein [Thermoanaerobaculia bacterium]